MTEEKNDKKTDEAKVTEAKPAEVKATEAKPEAKPVEAKPAEAKPAEAKPEAKPAEPKPEAKPAEAKPAEAKPAEAKPEAKAPPAVPDAEKAKEGEKLFYPNKWGRGVLTSAEEIMGEKGIAALLNMAKMPELIGKYPPDNMKKEFNFNQLSKLQQAFWEMYGSRGARVFATRAGEATFLNSLAGFKSVVAAAEVAMKVGSLDAKVKIGLEFFSKFFNAVSDQKVSIGEDDKHWLWIIETCPMCWNRKADEPICHLGVGVLQAAGGWMSGGKRFRILEVECKAKGNKNCVYAIEKVPVE